MPIGQGGIAAVPGAAQGDLPQFHGIFYGVVSNNADPLKKNRCLLRVPQLLGSAVTTWAISLTTLQTKPKVGTLVACMFVGGDLDYPAYMVVDPTIVTETNAANIKKIAVSSAAGSSTNVAAADHVHGGLEPSSTKIQPITSGQTASAGTSGTAAQADHVHDATGVLGIGINGLFEVTSGTLGFGDTPGVMALESRLYAGQNQATFSVQQFIVSGQVNCNTIKITTAPANPSGGNNSYSITGQNTITSPGTSYSQTWAQEVQATVSVLFGAFNALQSSFDTLYGVVDAIYNSLY